MLSASILLIWSIQRQGNTKPPLYLTFDQDQAGRNISPSALIPFCAYQTNLEPLGTSIANLSFPVCTAFRPFLLQGQLCYSLDLKNTSMKGDSKLKQGIEGGIMVIIDPNSERSIRGHAPSRAKLGQGNRINLSPKAQEGRSAFVNIHTLVRWLFGFDGFQLACFPRYRVSNEGDFLLRSPKRMTGTDGFLEQDSRRTGCQRENQDVCLGRKLAEEGFKKCACRPWGLLSALPNEVTPNGEFYLLFNH